MAYRNWIRTYTFKAGVQGQKGFIIGNLESPKETALRISFDVEKSKEESPNNGKVKIWNLSNDNLRILESKDCIAELKAGYDGNNALVILGSITSCITTMDNSDRMTELEVVDGRIQMRDCYISISLNGKVNGKAIYEQIAQSMGIPVIFAEKMEFKDYPNGFSYVGTAKKGLDNISIYCGHTWSMQNQILQVVMKGMPVSSKSYLLSDDTGLISIPKRISLDGGDGESKTGWEADYFLNAAIGINDIVQLQSNSINGYCQIDNIKISGDNFNGDWKCTAQMLEVKTDTM